MFSGGAGSWATAKRVAERHGTDELTLLFADTLIEDEDLYRFVEQAAENVGAPLERIAEGRDPWEVFFDVRFLGNSQVDPCSRVLKRELLRHWLEDNCDPASTIVYLGISWDERHRYDGAIPRWAPWTVEAPMIEKPYLGKTEILQELERAGIKPPRLYELGFAHNNCGGFCVKGGQAQFERLLRTMPERYAYHERREQELREFLDADVAIIRDRGFPERLAYKGWARSDVERRAGVGWVHRASGEKLPNAVPVTMRAFRERLEKQPSLFDSTEWAGCGCGT